MADQTALAFPPGGGAEGKAGGGKLALILGIAAVTFLSVAAGVGTAFLIATPTPAPPEASAEGAETAATVPVAYEGEAGPLALVPMTPVVTNITAPASAVIRIEASLVVRSDLSGDPAVLAAEIGADTLAFARSLELAQIEGARGLLHLREDLKERATLRSPAVVDFIIHALIAQ